MQHSIDSIKFSNDIAREARSRGFPFAAKGAAELAARGLIEYIAFPPQLAGRYQSFTEADLSQLRAAGYDAQFMDVGTGVAAYVKAHLAA